MKTLITSVMFAISAPLFAQQIMTDIPPVFYAVQSANIPTERVEILLEADQDIHHFALKPSQIEPIEKADIFIYSGDDVMPGLDEKILQINPDIRIIDISKISTDFNPHFWVSPEELINVVEAIETELGETLSTKSKLETANSQLKKIHSNLNFISDHDIFEQFAKTYNIQYLGAFTDAHDHKIGTRSHSELREKINENTCVIINAHEPNPELKHIAEDQGAQVVAFDPMGWKLHNEGDFFTAYYTEIASIFSNCTN